MIFSTNFDHRKVNPLIYIKFWQQACIPSLLFGIELMSITPSLSSKLERCHSWFLKNTFFVPDHAPSLLLLRLSGLNSIDSEIHIGRLLFLGRLITEPKMAPAVTKNLFTIRVDIFFNSNIGSMGIIAYTN